MNPNIAIETRQWQRSVAGAQRSAEEWQIRRFVEYQYQQKFSAAIEASYPNWIALHDNSQLLSAIGYRDCGDDFFVEYYTRRSVEVSIAELYGTTVNRSEVVELGNFAATSNRSAILMLQQVWSRLIKSGCLYVVFTGTQDVIRLFKSLPHYLLAEANPHAIPNGERWGNYYSHHPVVVCARLADYDHRFSVGRLPEGCSVMHLHRTEFVE